MAAGMVRIGDFDAASDQTTGFLIRLNGTESQDAVIALITPVAAGIIANNPTIIEAAETAAEAAVGEAVTEVGAVVGIPTSQVGMSSLERLPISWTSRAFADPVTDQVTDAITATYTNGTRYGKDVPLLRNDTGVLFDSVIPSNVARKSDIPDVVQIDVMERPIATGVPVFAARHAAARVGNQPCAVVFAGSSTTASMPGYVVDVVRRVQESYRVPGQTSVQKDSDALFVKHTQPGIHGYNVGQFGVTSANYLTDEECDRIAALDPALIVHMIGSNDFQSQMVPATYRANLEARLAYFDSVLTKPTQHLFVHAYERQDFTPATYQWGEYLDQLDAIAGVRADSATHDLTPAYTAIGFPDGDPMGFLASDLIHQSPEGAKFMSGLVAPAIVS